MFVHTMQIYILLPGINYAEEVLDIPHANSTSRLTLPSAVAALEAADHRWPSAWGNNGR